MSETNEMLKELCEECTSMSDWEVEFIDSCAKWVADKKFLSAKQRDKIGDIYIHRMVHNG